MGWTDIIERVLATKKILMAQWNTEVVGNFNYLKGRQSGQTEIELEKKVIVPSLQVGSTYSNSGFYVSGSGTIEYNPDYTEGDPLSEEILPPGYLDGDSNYRISVVNTGTKLDRVGRWYLEGQVKTVGVAAAYGYRRAVFTRTSDGTTDLDADDYADDDLVSALPALLTTFTLRPRMILDVTALPSIINMEIVSGLTDNGSLACNGSIVGWFLGPIPPP